MVNNLKDPRGVVPSKLWIGLQQEGGPFPYLVAELIKALSGDKFPSFQELLKIFCGGNRSQTCSFCSTRIIVVAVHGEGKGCWKGISTVSILPFLPPLFNCGALACENELSRKMKAGVGKLLFGLAVAVTRLQTKRCDYCFMLAEKVHRYDD